ncbi:MAG: hypothetical protein AUK24_07985 [Syntrophaceae bacterium CG2_30_49_12]|nr:MAG: hypothetical protein AUK24_07985 [Syntrophaceae bacterium CG2_30_49_12]PIP06907.1 MAG: hypothetical protein COX52_05635 [Syntrophobacterales bacterium CG23_combo_of_CG06-09_8_20_14_all_48_27]PJC76456.1 MAG: hypothetical protein CO012_01220 [Syntrophobacterales bacterium CG_4_8_14_3_um_filter_49_14]
MAGFGFTEEQEMFRETVQRFARREIAPGAKERAKKAERPLELIKKAADQGLVGLAVPQKFGGSEADWVTVGIAVEEMSKADFGLGMLPVLPGLFSILLTRYCSEEMQQRYLPAMARGECSGCFAITEADCGSDVAAIRTKAVRDGDHYIINGEKTGVSGGMDAHIAVAPIKTNPQAGAKGISMFVLPLDLPGVSRSRIPDMGFNQISRGTLFLDNVRLPVEYRISEEGKGFYLIMGQFEVLRVFLSIAALGLAQASLTEAIEYAKIRKAFDRPIVQFEGVSFKIAEHATWIEAARLLCYRTLYLADQGLEHNKESAMCKWFCPVVAVNAIHDSLLIHGHVGYSEEHPVEQRLRDAIGFEMADGTANIMKIIISRQLVGREFLPSNR